MPSDNDFPGFPQRTFEFLAALSRNNTKEWFDAHRGDYKDFYVAPAVALASALRPHLWAISPTVKVEPRINGSLLRINRDTRFSRNKAPYRTHIDLVFWEGERRGFDSPSFLFRLEPNTLTIGAGIVHLGKDALAKYRAAVANPELAESLRSIVRELTRDDTYAVIGKMRGSYVRGIEEGSDLAKNDSLWAAISGPVPTEARSSALVDYCARHYGAMSPLIGWLLRDAGIATASGANSHPQ